MTALVGWERPYFQDTDQNPLVFLVAFGADLQAQPMSRSEFQCSGVPGGVTLQTYTTSGHPGYLESLRSGYLWEEFQARDPALAEAVAGCQGCAVMAGDVEAAGTLNYLRDVIGLGEWLFACGAKTIFDPQAFTWWTRETWHSELFVAGQAQPHKHVQILMSDTADQFWLHTRGMRLFGRPDLSVRNVPASSVETATMLINRLIAFQALGGVIEDGLEFTMAGLPDGMPCRLQGDLEDPDFNNLHAEMSWPG
jgi:hypothetical protein